MTTQKQIDDKYAETEIFELKSKKRSVRYAFSMHELLIVIAILALLSILIFPILRSFQAQNRLVTCRNSLMNLTMANLSYAQDAKSFVPGAIGDDFRWHGVKGGGNFKISNRWDGVSDEDMYNPENGPLASYLGKELIQPCPKYKIMAANTGNSSSEPGGFSYGYNINLGSLRCVDKKNDYWEKPCQVLGLPRKSLRDPGETIMFSESATLINSSGDSDTNGELATYAFCEPFSIVNRGEDYGSTPNPSVHFRHQGRCNTAWADGHVTLTRPEFSKGLWGKRYFGYIGSKANRSYIP